MCRRVIQISEPLRLAIVDRPSVPQDHVKKWRPRYRCIVPVDGFFEWKANKGQKQKQPYAIAMKNGAPFGIAGVWETWKHPERGERIDTFAILTIEACLLCIPSR